MSRVTAASQRRQVDRLDLAIALGQTILALTVRVKFDWPALTGAQGLLQSDALDYHKLAVSLLQTGSLSENGILAYRMPFFPMVLAAIYAVSGPGGTCPMPWHSSSG